MFVFATGKIPDNCDIFYVRSNNDTCYTGVQNKEKIMIHTEAAGLTEVRVLSQITNYKDEWRATPGIMFMKKQIKYFFVQF